MIHVTSYQRNANENQSDILFQQEEIAIIKIKGMFWEKYRNGGFLVLLGETWAIYKENRYEGWTVQGPLMA